MTRRKALIIGIPLVLVALLVWALTSQKEAEMRQKMNHEKSYYENVTADLKASKNMIKHNEKIMKKVEPKNDEKNIATLNKKTEELIAILEKNENKNANDRKKALTEDLQKFGIKDGKMIETLISTRAPKAYTLKTGTIRSDVMEIMVDYSRKRGSSYMVATYDTLSEELVDVTTYIDREVSES